jgi:hypothetical protein
MMNSATRLVFGNRLRKNADWAIVYGGETCGIAFTLWIGVLCQGRFVDSHEISNKHNTASTVVPGSLRPAYILMGCAGEVFASLALAENAMIA